MEIKKISRSLDVNVCTHAGQVEHQRCSRTGRVQKIQKILIKKIIRLLGLYIVYNLHNSNLDFSLLRL